MLGWLADLFRLVWGLIYWNFRKSWFRLRRGRAACPCQSPSDSGRAFETRCEACIYWHRPSRFRRVCPLLVETPDGLRCSADTAAVRPFWGRAIGIYGGSLAALYVAGALGVFALLRTVGYPVSVLDVGLPTHWYKLSHARSWFFIEQSNRAFAAGRTVEGLLYLANAYEFDPANYQIGLTLAKHHQVNQPAQSNRIFEQLMRDHPDRRAATAQDWFRALLARGNFERIVGLARDELLAGSPHANAWIRAFFFAARQTGNLEPLRELLASRDADAIRWHRLLETELLLRTGRTVEARASLHRPWPPDSPPFALYYRATAFIALRDTTTAIDLVIRSRPALGDELWMTLQLEAYASAGLNNQLRAAVDLLFASRLELGTIKVLCAHLIRYPDREIFSRLCTKLDREPVPLTPESAGIWFSLLCTAGAVGDDARLALFTTKLKQASETPFVALGIVEAFFRGRTSERRITSFLPILPLPLEVTYALIERYNPPPPYRASLVVPAAK